MDGFKEFQGKDLDSAIKDACSYFDARREQLEIEILQDAKSGIFGIVGARKAKIRARRVRLRETMESVLGSEFGHGEADVAGAPGAPSVAGASPSVAPQAGQSSQARPSQPAGQGKPASPASQASSTSPVAQSSQGQRRQEAAQASQARPEAPKADAGSPSVQPEAKGEAKPVHQPSPLQPHRPLRDGRGRQGPGRGQGRGVPEPIAMDLGSELAFHAEGAQGSARDQGMEQGGETGSSPRETGRRPAQGRRRGQDGRGRQSPFASADMIDMRDPRLGRSLREGRGPKSVREARDVRDGREMREGRERGQRRERIRPSDASVSRPDGQPHGQSVDQPSGQCNVQAQGLAVHHRPPRHVPPRDVPPLTPRTAFD